MLKSLLETKLAAAVCSGLLMAASVGVPSAHAGEISLGHNVWVGYGPLYLARDLGYYKDLGLKLTLKSIDGNEISMAAQAAGHLSGTATTVDDMLKYRSKDFCFKTVLTLDESVGGDAIVATNDIKKIEDIKGKTVAFDEGSTSQFIIAYLMKKAGMPLNSIKVASMSADSAATAFIAGHVQVAVTWEPHLSLIKSKNVGHILLDTKAMPGAVVDIVELSCSVIEKQPADVKALITGYYKALDYMKTNPTEAATIMAKGVGGFLSDPKDFAEAATGVRFFDKADNILYMGQAGKPGAIGDVVKLGSEIWSELGRMKYGNVTYDDVVDARFIAQ